MATRVLLFAMCVALWDAAAATAASPPPPRACCKAMTVECLACAADQTVLAWCKDNSESEWAIGCDHVLQMDHMMHDDDPCTNCEEDPTSGEVMCMIMDCQPIGCSDPWCAQCSTGEVVHHAPGECCPRCVPAQPCCRAETPECLSCTAGQTMAEFCAENPYYMAHPDCMSLGCCYRFGFGARMEECCFAEHTANTEAECTLKGEQGTTLGGGFKFSADTCEAVKSSQGLVEVEYEEYEEEYEYESEYESEYEEYESEYEEYESEYEEYESEYEEEVEVDKPVACCMAMMPTCLACSAGQTVKAWCKANQGTEWAQFAECRNFVSIDGTTTTDNRNSGDPVTEAAAAAPQEPGVCCEAMTPSCLACSAGQTVKAWCKANRNSEFARSVDCESVPRTAAIVVGSLAGVVLVAGVSVFAWRRSSKPTVAYGEMSTDEVGDSVDGKVVSGVVLTGVVVSPTSTVANV